MSTNLLFDKMKAMGYPAPAPNSSSASAPMSVQPTGSTAGLFNRIAAVGYPTPTNMSRNTAAEKTAVDTFTKAQGHLPSTQSDWQKVYTSVYGNKLPNDPAIQKVFNMSVGTGANPAVPTTSATPTAPTANPSVSGATNLNVGSASSTINSSAPPASGNLNYRGFDIGDKALQGAYGAYQATSSPNDFLNVVRQKLKEKFQPESETLGVGDWAKSVGWSGPQGWNTGIQEKNLAIRQKGALALDALGKANDLYSEAAKNAKQKFDDLWGMRDDYDKAQKDMENELEDLALAIAKTGGSIPADLLNMLPAERRGWYSAMANAVKSAEARSKSGGSAKETYNPLSYQEWLAKKSSETGSISLADNAARREEYNQYKLDLANQISYKNREILPGDVYDQLYGKTDSTTEWELKRGVDEAVNAIGSTQEKRKFIIDHYPRFAKEYPNLFSDVELQAGGVTP